jgi:hypothetical protein
MVAKSLQRRFLRIGLWYLAVVFGFGLVLSLVEAYMGSLVFATYRGPLEFTGHKRLFSTTYVSIKWVRDPAVPAPCPLIVHLTAGDVGEREFAEPGSLLNFGMREVPYEITPEAAALFGPNWPDDLPRVVKFGQGDLRVATQHTGGQLTGVWVCVVEPGHETVARSPGGTQYPISVNGRRLTLPLPEAELVRLLGVPESRRKDY